MGIEDQGLQSKGKEIDDCTGLRRIAQDCAGLPRLPGLPGLQGLPGLPGLHRIAKIARIAQDCQD